MHSDVAITVLDLMVDKLLNLCSDPSYQRVKLVLLEGPHKEIAQERIKAMSYMHLWKSLGTVNSSILSKTDEQNIKFLKNNTKTYLMDLLLKKYLYSYSYMPPTGLENPQQIRNNTQNGSESFHQAKKQLELIFTNFPQNCNLIDKFIEDFIAGHY